MEPFGLVSVFDAICERVELVPRRMSASGRGAREEGEDIRLHARLDRI